MKKKSCEYIVCYRVPIVIDRDLFIDEYQLWIVIGNYFCSLEITLTKFVYSQFVKACIPFTIIDKIITEKTGRHILGFQSFCASLQHQKKRSPE